MKQHDAFISHASEDKRYFVRPLSQKLQEYGAIVWYDEFSLRPGMSLSRTVEQGLSNSKFGIVVLSKSFFKKKWTQYELQALNSFEIDNPGVIIPIWYKVNIDDVREFSPYLAGKLAIVCEKKTIDEVALEILETIRLDLFEGIMKRRVWDDLRKNSERIVLTKEEADTQIKFGPIRHEELPIELMIRIRLIRASLFEVIPHSFSYWLEGFQRDVHPEDEVHEWEKIASAYLESVSLIQSDNIHKKQEIFAIILSTFYSISSDNVNIKTITDNEKQIINNICSFVNPIFDILDKPFGEK